MPVPLNTPRKRQQRGHKHCLVIVLGRGKVRTKVYEGWTKTFAAAKQARLDYPDAIKIYSIAEF